MSEAMNENKDPVAGEVAEDIAADTGGRAQESIKMSPQEEQDAAEHSSLETEPADEGVGALTDNTGEHPATNN